MDETRGEEVSVERLESIISALLSRPFNPPIKDWRTVREGGLIYLMDGDRVLFVTNDTGYISLGLDTGGELFAP